MTTAMSGMPGQADTPDYQIRSVVFDATTVQITFLDTTELGIRGMPLEYHVLEIPMGADSIADQELTELIMRLCDLVNVAYEWRDGRPTA